MWNMRRNINPQPMAQRRSTVQFIYTDLPTSKRNWWLIVEPGKEPDLCSVDPGYDVDLYVTTDLRTMTEVWMGYTSVARAKNEAIASWKPASKCGWARAGLTKWKNASPEQTWHEDDLVNLTTRTPHFVNHRTPFRQIQGSCHCGNI